MEPVPVDVLPEASAARAERVREARSRMPLASHAHLDLSGAEDVVTVLEDQGRTRIPELLPVRYGRMLASPFAFYRGAAAVMAADLSRSPNTGLTAQLCGDAHVSNFGIFATPERRQVFDLNDFDETWPGPFDWDVKRLAASLEIAGRGNGLRRKRRRAITVAAARAYRRSMAQFAGQATLEVWYARAELQPGLPRLKEVLPKPARVATEKMVNKSRTRDSLQALGKLTTVEDGRPRFLSDPPLLVPMRDLASDLAEDLEEWLDRILGQYRESLQSDRRVLLDRYRVVDLARKAVGVGSVGTRAWLFLLLDEAGEPLMLQAKEAAPSVLAAHLPGPPLHNQGQRVVEGQRLMQASSDILLGWQRTLGVDGIERDFYVRQFRDWKGGFEIEAIDDVTLEMLGQLCAWTLARAHARSGDRRDIAAYLGAGETGADGDGDGEEFDEAVADFAVAYADKNDHDHASLEAAVEAGRVPVTRDR